MDARDLRQEALRKRSEAARARSFGRGMLAGDRDRLLAYANDLENEAADLGRRADTAEKQERH